MDNNSCKIRAAHFRYLSSQEAARREQANLQSDLEKVRSSARAHKNGHLE